MLVNNFKNNLNTNLTKMSRLQGQLATNRKAAHVSDDPIATIYSQQANYKLMRLAQYVNNVEHAQNWTQQTETGMMELNEIIKNVYEACIDASTDVKNKKDIVNASRFVGQMLDQIITALNTAYGDKYVFGGYNSVGYYSSATSKLRAPFSADAATGELLFNEVSVNEIFMTYNDVRLDPDAATPEQKAIGKLYEDVMSFIVGPGIELPVNFNGLQLVMYDKGTPELPRTDPEFRPPRNIYEVVYGLHQAMITTSKLEPDYILVPMDLGDPPALEDKDNPGYKRVPVPFDPANDPPELEDPNNPGYKLRERTLSAEDLMVFIKPLQDSQSYVLARTAELGGRTNRLDMLLSRYGQDEIAYFQMKSDAEDADQSEVIMNYKMAEAVYKAALSSGAYIIQPTLMDFLR